MVTDLQPIKDTNNVNASKDFYEISIIRISVNETSQGNRIVCPTGMLKNIIFGLNI